MGSPLVSYAWVLTERNEPHDQIIAVMRSEEKVKDLHEQLASEHRNVIFRRVVVVE